MILPATRRIVGKPSSIAGHLRPVGCRPGCKSKEEVERLREQLERRNQRIAELEKQVKEQQKKIAEEEKKITEGEKKIADLERRLALRGRNSTNSSKPPSSDGLAGPERKRGCGKPKSKKRRRSGGQKGHPGHSRPLFPPEKVDRVVEVLPDSCGHCQKSFAGDGDILTTQGEPWRYQVTELPEIKPLVTEYQMKTVIFPCCNKPTKAQLPAEVKGQFGERLTASIAYMKVRCNIPQRPMQCLLEEVMGTSVSQGGMQKIWEEASAAVAAPCEELEQALPEQPVLNCDETSSRTNKEKRWLWVFVAQTFVYFSIEISRSTEVLDRLLKHFSGILGADRMASYQKFVKGKAEILMQFCWAHFKRDLLGALEVARTVQGKRFCRDALAEEKKLFRLWHRFRNQTSSRGSPPLTRKQLIKEARPIQKQLLRMAKRNLNCKDKEARNLATALSEHHDKFFTFIYHEGVEPTNNVSERAVRNHVQRRKISFGNRSRNGELALARLLSVHATCRLQKRSSLHYLIEAVRCHRAGKPAPSLLPAPSQLSRPK
jgi:transposase